MESNILQTLLSHDNAMRKRAEESLMTERNTNPANLLNILIEGMKSGDQGVAQLGALMYKKLFLDDARVDQLSPSDLDMMQQAVMATISDISKENMTLLKRKGDIISKIYSKMGRSEEFLKLLSSWAQSDSINARELSMYLFEVVLECHLPAEKLTAYKDSFMSLFSQSLTDKEVKVRVAALKATISFLTNIEDTDIVMGFQGIIPQLLNTVVESLKENEDQGRQALESMHDLTTACPEIWKQATPQLVNVISQVMIQKNFENGTRSAATEVVLALSREMPASLRKVEETKSMFLPALVQMLTEVEEDMQTWAESTDEKEAVVGNTDPHNVAINAINCISTDLGEKTILMPFSALIQNCIRNQKWQERQAGYMVMGLIAEACKESMSKNMAEAMKMACMGIIDENVRVRYAGLSCLALLLTELSPKAQKKYHQELMPVLLKMMASESLIKMQTHAVSTVINFANGLHSEDDEEEDAAGGDNSSIIKIYSDQLFEILVNLLKKGIDSNYEPLQEEVMNLLSAVAQLIEKEFSKYFSVLIPLMMQILINVGTSNQQQMNLRAKTIETMGYMIEAVAEKKSTFLQNVTEITTYLVQLLTSGQLSNEDPQIQSIKETLSKIGYFMKEDFHPYFAKIFPQLLEDAKQKIDIKLTAADDITGDQEEGTVGFNLKLKGFEGQQKISMNTSAFQAKLTAFKIINQISENLEKSFAPYCEAILPVMLENFAFKFSEALRKQALKTCVNILHAVDEPINVNVFQVALYPALITQIQQSLESQDLKALKTLIKHFWLMVKTLNEDNKKHKNYLSEAQFAVIGPLFGKVLNLVKETKAASSKVLSGGKKNFVLDEEDLEKIKEELGKISRSATYVMEVSGQLVLNFGEQVASMVKTHFLNFFALNLNAYKTLSESELLDSTCFFCDFIQYSYHNAEAVAMMTELNSKFLEIFNSGEEVATTDVKQTLTTGFGIFAMHIPNANYASIAPQILIALNSVISEPQAMDEDNIVATESAIGALGRVMIFQRQAAPALITDALVSLFLERLPLKNEEEEAQKTHKLLFEHVLAGNPNVMAEATKEKLLIALNQIKVAASQQGQGENLVIVCEEGLELLKKILP